jgi:hypothetical protein
MLIHNPHIAEGSAIINATIPSGNTFPSSPDVGELFFLMAGNIGLHAYMSGGWKLLSKAEELANHATNSAIHLTTTQATQINKVADLITTTGSLSTDLSNHILDFNKHLTTSQNTFIDNITVTAAEVNKLTGIATYLGADNISTKLSLLTSSKLNVDGTNFMLADLNIAGFKLKNVATPAAATDGANKDYVDKTIRMVIQPTLFLSSGNINVPAGATAMFVSGCGAGGGGGGGAGSVVAGLMGNRVGSGGGGGGAGQYVYKSKFNVVAGTNITVIVGLGGTGGTSGGSGINGADGANGGASSVGITGDAITQIVPFLAGGGGGKGGLSVQTSAAGGAGGTGYPSGAFGDDGVYGSNGSHGGAGASSMFGPGGGPGKGRDGGSRPGINAAGFGAGGGGGGGSFTNSGSGSIGAAGSNGFILLEWY